MTSAPSEYVIVKREPTQEMCQEGQWKAREWPKFPLRIVPIYAAMLSASPRPDRVLTDAEIDAVVREQWGAGVNIPAAHRAVARAVESAIMKKLGAA